ncbi:DUF6640 family protein [Citricoccus alkalitolerans]|uniref:DUF6640 family protein n=1 Tax=Citricoccus alkalitolerans TaxID=246603 RepID=A0ABV8Y392_9MICC
MPAGRTILNVVAGITTVGGLAADWNRTHLFNPNWPPHARFHDAMTVTLGTLLGAGALYALNRQSTDPDRDTTLGAMLPAAFWTSMGAAFAFPGARGLQAEFPHLVPRIKDVWINERFASAGMLALTAIGYGLERRARRGHAHQV